MGCVEVSEQTQAEQDLSLASSGKSQEVVTAGFARFLTAFGKISVPRWERPGNGCRPSLLAPPGVLRPWIFGKRADRGLELPVDVRDRPREPLRRGGYGLRGSGSVGNLAGRERLKRERLGAAAADREARDGLEAPERHEGRRLEARGPRGGGGR